MLCLDLPAPHPFRRGMRLDMSHQSQSFLSCSIWLNLSEAKLVLVNPCTRQRKEHPVNVPLSRSSQMLCQTVPRDTALCALLMRRKGTGPWERCRAITLLIGPSGSAWPQPKGRLPMPRSLLTPAEMVQPTSLFLGASVFKPAKGP